MQFLDARRLTGPNVLWNGCGAVVDIACTADEADSLVPFCEQQIVAMLDAVGWGTESVRHIRLAGGVSIAFSAPIDALYAASAIGEFAWAACDAHFNGADAVDFGAISAEIRAAIAEEVNPALLQLEQAALAHNVSFLWDDDEVSVGLGTGSEVWPFRELPGPGQLDWSQFHDIPVGIVTGTNGKTTSVRIAKHILQSTGKQVGLSCTDWVSVNDRIIDRDDWSGPGGARLVLRQKDVDVAILETARGGLLRRGLGVNKADAALITNIAEDHLGDFGSQNVHELLDIKWVVSHAVVAGGTLVLNADDDLLVAKSAAFAGRIVWFSLREDNLIVARHIADGGGAYVYANNELRRYDGSEWESICAAKDIPLTLDGAALHNIANCLGAAALTAQLGMTLDEIRAGLTSMSQASNPGRSNLYDVRGFKVLVDFAHNPEAMQALFSMASVLPARRRALCFGQAGDRTDEQIRQLARSAWAIGLDKAMIAELEGYRRGREAGEVFALLRDELLKAGAQDEQIVHFATESDSFDAALEWAETDDLVVILDLGRDSNVQDKIAAVNK